MEWFPAFILIVLALASTRLSFLKSFSFALWVSLFFVVSVSFPGLFGSWFGLDLQYLIVPLIQVIMFGMGTTLSVKDFRLVLKMPVPVFLGLLLQYSLMPLIGFGLAHLFSLSPGIAAGVILVGCSPGGVASNLMAYIARGNVALSVTMTACSTLASPLLTPFLMEKLAGELIPIPFAGMMISILNMIIIPIVTGILAHYILYTDAPLFKRKLHLGLMGGSFLGVGMALLSLSSRIIPSLLLPLKGGMFLGMLLLSAVTLLRMAAAGRQSGSAGLIDRVLPFVSMAGICLIIAIISSRSVEELKSAGLLLVLISATHCFLGFASGYWLGRLSGLSRKDCRTISFEVGMQNSGMASGLAISVLDNIRTALPPAIFGPLMNISGSLLANHWGKEK